jgi:hypothetical protein
VGDGQRVGWVFSFPRSSLMSRRDRLDPYLGQVSRSEVRRTSRLEQGATLSDSDELQWQQPSNVPRTPMDNERT